ncbi:hypothetical protein [Paenibacillus germinis]|uniref:hypothetical protein n=1 Tax=Paenibacillus germinis TaxID=2654979 RepID=UPI0014922FDE|nr:hypothetical protein [Paenibacillus germinis]
MVVMFIIIFAGILLFFLLKPPLQPETDIEVVYENVSSVDLSITEIAYIKRIDA